MAAKLVKPSIMARTEDGSPVVEVFAFEYKDGKLVMDCKALGSMRMDVIIAPEDLAKGWSIIKKDRGALMQFAKRLPKALRAQKKKERSVRVGQITLLARLIRIERADTKEDVDECISR